MDATRAQSMGARGHLRRPVLLYDAGCRFCRFAARLVARLDRRRRLALLPLRDPDAAPLLAPLPEEERYASWFLALPDGSLAGRGAGAVELVRLLPATRALAWPLARIPTNVLDAGYRVLAERRHLLGRLVPDGPAPRRFP
jgi:predicted DCC family thiol-disulfide oxidoreductase YuxK